MFKYLKYRYLTKIVKDPILAAKIYEMIYHKTKFEITPTIYSTVVNVEGSRKSDEIPDTKNLQRKELEKTLLYLKAKPVKTKEEKDSIGIIEAVLKNER